MWAQNKYTTHLKYTILEYHRIVAWSFLLIKELFHCRSQYTLTNVYMEMCHAVSAGC